MSEHLPLDAFEEEHELKEIPFLWAVIFGVAAVIIPLVLYLAFYLSEVKDVLNFTFPDIAIWITILLSFFSPYIASIAALLHAKHNLGVKQRGKLFVHGLHVILIPCGIGAAAFIITIVPVGGTETLMYIGLIFYIPYIILGVVISALQSFLMSRQQPLISNKTFF